MNQLERCLTFPFILPMYIAIVPCMLAINSINMFKNKIRILKLFNSIRVGSILEFKINNDLTRTYFVLFKSDNRIELVKHNALYFHTNTQIKIINKDKVLTSWDKMVKNTCKMIDIDVWAFKIVELPNIPRWIQNQQLQGQRTFLVTHRFHVYARRIQHAWRAYAKHRKRNAVALIENAVLHAMYRPGGWLAPTQFAIPICGHG